MMNAISKIDFRKTSLAILIAYTVCAAILVMSYTSKFYPDARLIAMIVAWAWIVIPQLILFQYVCRFLQRWAKLVSLLLQIIIFIFSIYSHGAAILMPDDIQHDPVFLFIPIWHYVIVATAGLVMKIIQSY